MVDLKKAGVYAYAEHPSTSILCMAYAFGDEPIDLVEFEATDEKYNPTEPLRSKAVETIIAHVKAGGALVAHNAAFERTIWHHVLHERHGWPDTTANQWRCTMAEGYAMGLPGALGMMADAVGLPQGKDWTGYQVMMKMAKPRSVHEGTPTWWYNREKRRKLYSYCKQDVEAERAIEKRVRRLLPEEHTTWRLDQKINDRGVHIDQKLAEACKDIIKAAQKRLNADMRTVTNYQVKATTNVAQLTQWVNAQGVACDSIDKATIEDILDGDVSDNVRRALEIRREAGKSSVAKIDTLLRGTQSDGRCRGLLQYHAAATGRWGGRRFQPQNLKRPETDDVEHAVACIMKGDIDLIEAMHGPALSVVGDVLRGLIIAEPGSRLLAADYSGIESRVLAWLAEETWKIDAYRAYDAGEGPGIYELVAAGILKKPVEAVTKGERQATGKVPELACGFQGGVGAFQAMARAYGVSITDEEADAIKQGWRERNPNTRQFWYDIEDAAMKAVRHPGRRTSCGPLQFRCKGSWLGMRLPSNRKLWYAYPVIKDRLMPWTDDDGGPVYKPQIHHHGVDSTTGKFVERAIYGGLLTENAVQAIARDLLRDSMLHLDELGYSIVLTVHDEIVTEEPEGRGSLKEMLRTMEIIPEWAKGMPVAAEGYEAERYRK